MVWVDVTSSSQGRHRDSISALQLVLDEAHMDNMVLIYIILAVVFVAAVFGWFYSPRTRRLVIFAILTVVIGAIIFGILAFIRRTWFPLPPL